VEFAGRAPELLLRALARLRAREVRPQIHASIYTLLREAGEARGGLEGFVLSHPALVDLFVMDRLLSHPATRAAITSSCQVTGFAGALAPNVVPGEVSATLDCRLLPGAKSDEVVAELKAVVADESVTFEVLASEPATESPWQDPVFAALARQLAAGRPDVAVGPVLSVGITDSAFARPLGARAYGFAPFEVSEEEAATMHGHAERVSVENVKRGLRVYLSAVAEIVTSPR
jgi:carboxypeptidase PM20D1